MSLFAKPRKQKRRTTVKCEGKGKGRRCCVYDQPFTGQSVPKRCWVSKPGKRMRRKIEKAEPSTSLDKKDLEVLVRKLLDK